jgi:hypothetical protein
MADDPVFDHLFLGAGAMKAGTTWIYDVLHRHPDIHFSQEKEIHYFYARHLRPDMLSDRARMQRAKGYLHFDPDLSRREVLRRRVLWTAAWLDGPVDDAWFNALFRFRGSARWMAEFSNMTARLPAEAWRDIAARTRRLRVLYTLREPLDRTWSHVRFHLKMQGQDHLLEEWSLDDLIAHIHAGDYLDHSDYVAAIDRMRAGLPEDALRVDFYDRIARDPRGYIADIEAFLGVDPHPVPDDIIDRVVNPSPARPMPEGLAEALAPMVRAQVDGLRARGITPPETWQG